MWLSCYHCIPPLMTGSSAGNFSTIYNNLLPAIRWGTSYLITFHYDCRTKLRTWRVRTDPAASRTMQQHIMTRFVGARPFLSEGAVLDVLAQVSLPVVLGLGVFLDDSDRGASRGGSSWGWRASWEVWWTWHRSWGGWWWPPWEWTAPNLQFT